MANRQNTLLIKRSNIIGKIPPISGLTLGEIALNTADAKLYTLFTSGTTGATEVRQIGWDRVSKTGDTITGDLIINGGLTATTISATTYQNLPVSGLTAGSNISLINNNGNYTISATGSGGGGGGDYLPLSGGTVTGTTYFTQGVSGNTVSATTFTFDTTYTGATPYGSMNWNLDFGVPQVGMIGGNVVQKVGESVYAYVKNVDTTTLNKGEVVYLYGASGDKISVQRASNTGDTTSSKTLGIVAESIAVNGLGYVITQGTLDGLDLSAYNPGDILWLGSTPGQFTKTKQYAPYHLVFIGVVQRANVGNGQMYVKPQNGYEFEELHDVAVTGATFGDLITYSASNGYNLWVNTKTLPGSYTITGNTNVGENLTVSGNTSLQGLTATTISGNGGGITNVANRLIAITQLTASTLVTDTIGTTTFDVINLNSDGTNRFAKTTFVAPISGKVLIDMTFDMTIVNSAAVQMIGLNSTTGSTATPSDGWYRINADNDATSGQFYAKFIKTGLTPGVTYTYYFMGVCNFSSNTIRTSSVQTGSYSAGSDLPSPLTIMVYDLGGVSITTNPSS